MSSVSDLRVADAKARALEIAQKLAAKLGGGHAHPVATGANDSVLGKRGRDEMSPFSSSSPSHSSSVSLAEKRRRKVPFPTVPADFNFLGLIIGPRGQTQKQLEQQSGARILVRGRGASKEGEDGSEEEMHVLILGDDDAQVEKAEALVNELLYNPEKALAIKQQQLREVALQQQSAQSQHDGGEGYGSSYSSSPSSLHGSNIGEHTMEMRIPNERVGLVIGKMGDTIRQLQQMTGCSIQVAKESPPGDSEQRIVTLRGTDEQIVRADEEIKRVINSGGLRASFTSLSSSPSSSHPGLGFSSSQTMHIPNIAVGLLIGKNGETIRSMQEKTGAVIQVQRNTEVDPSSSTREVTLNGTEQQVEAARREVEFIIQEKMELESRKNSMMGGGAGGDGRDAGPPGSGTTGGGDAGGRTTVVLRVPNAAVGTIIGRGGETIKRLQVMTAARIQIDRNDETKTEREVTISGSPEDVDRARLEVEELVRQKASGASVPPPPGYGYGRGPPSYPYGAPPPIPYGYPPYDPYGPPPPGYPPYYPPPAGDYNPYGPPPPVPDYGQHQQPPPQAAPPASQYDQPQTRAQSAQEQQASAPASASVATAPPTLPASQPPSVSIPTPPTDESQFTAYWGSLSYEQQQEYYRQYYPEMLAQLQQQQQQQQPGQ